jgi:hypothetical protein
MLVIQGRERLVHFTMSVIQADVNVWFTLQYNVCVAKATSFHNVSESGWCERLGHFTMSVSQADVNV